MTQQMNPVYQYLETKFSDLDLVDSANYVASIKKYPNFRIELGAGFANDDFRRVNQAKKRAFVIFEEVFKPQDELYTIVNDFADELFKGTRKVTELIQNRTFSQQQSKTFLNSADDKISFSQQTIQLKLADMNYQEIIEGIINHELVFEPSINQVVFFIHYLNDIGLYLYDDRGMMVWAKEPQQLENLRSVCRDWIIG